MGCQWSDGSINQTHMDADAEWGYVGDVGPSHWADLSQEFCACGGSHQSPIDLPRRGATEGTIDLDIRYEKAKGRLSYKSYGVQMTLNGGRLRLNGESYRLVQFHFHTPSEHRLGGEAFPGELHLVHVGDDGHIVVLGIFMADGDTHSGLSPIWSAFPTVEAAPFPFDPAVLLPDSREVYVYEGSLTTPPCTEDVTWLVLKQPMYLSDVQIENLTAVHAETNIHNNRPVQPLNDRDVDFLQPVTDPSPET